MDSNRSQTGFGLCGVEFMRQTLTDKSGKTLGFIQAISPYRVVLQNASGKNLGFYDPKLKQTFTASGRMVGHGNLLASLLN